MTKNNNSFNDTHVELTNNISSIIKESTPTVDMNFYSELVRGCIQPCLDMINTQGNLIQISLQPLLEQIDEINNSIKNNVAKLLSNIALESLNNIKRISMYNADTIESVDRSLFIETLDEICDTVDSYSSENSSIEELEQCKNSFFDFRRLIEYSPLAKENFYDFLGILLSLITAICSGLDNSSETIIEQQSKIIELQQQELDTIKSINNELQNSGVTLQNINKSLENFIESIEHKVENNH